MEILRSELLWTCVLWRWYDDYLINMKNSWWHKTAAWAHKLAAWAHKLAAWAHMLAAWAHKLAAWTHKLAAWAHNWPLGNTRWPLDSEKPEHNKVDFNVTSVDCHLISTASTHVKITLKTWHELSTHRLLSAGMCCKSTSRTVACGPARRHTGHHLPQKLLGWGLVLHLPCGCHSQVPHQKHVETREQGGDQCED